jgi:hypothetical protein
MMVDERVIVELKSVDVLAPIHEAQMLTYLRMTQCPVGLLINFNVQLLKDGIQRIVNPMSCTGSKLCQAARAARAARVVRFLPGPHMNGVGSSPCVFVRSVPPW